MGCNCGKAKRGTQAFTLKMPSGKTTTHATRLAAQAENTRQGGGGKIVTKT